MGTGFILAKNEILESILDTPKKVSKSDLQPFRKGFLGGAMSQFYERLTSINDGIKCLSDLFGGGFARYTARVEKMLEFRPLIGLPEVREVKPEEHAIKAFHDMTYLMGYDLLEYHQLNNPAATNSRCRKLMTFLNFGVRKRPISSINDLAAKGGESGGLNYMNDILRFLVDDFTRTTLAAPLKPNPEDLATLRLFPNETNPSP